MFHFTLDRGHDVSVKCLYCESTYNYLLIGSPIKPINDQIMKNAANRVKQMWGYRKIHMVQPEIDETNPEYPELPPVEITVWLDCHTPANPDFDGSELVVVWYRGEWRDQPLRDVLYDGLRSIPWSELAEDYNL